MVDVPRVAINPSRRLHVLIVDDDRDTVEVTAELVKLWGFEARTALDGTAALAAAQSGWPDVALLDLALPGLDGLTVAERLRRQNDPAHLLLVAVTGYGQEEMRRLSFARGFDVHLIKPVEPRSLFELLAERAQRMGAAVAARS